MSAPVVETLIVLGLGCVLVVEWALRTLVITSYRLFPCPRILDALYNRMRLLRLAFSRGLSGPDTASPHTFEFRELIEYHGYQVEDHYAETADGFCLVLHRIIPKQAHFQKAVDPATETLGSLASLQEQDLQHSVEKLSRVTHTLPVSVTHTRCFPSDNASLTTTGTSQSKRALGNRSVRKFCPYSKAPFPAAEDDDSSSSRRREVATESKKLSVFPPTRFLLKSVAHALAGGRKWPTSKPGMGARASRLPRGLLWKTSVNRKLTDWSSAIRSKEITDADVRQRVLHPPGPNSGTSSRKDNIVSSGLRGTVSQFTNEHRGHPVLCMHGLMMSSEVFVVVKDLSIPLYLADLGYDVWLGNNRGNKYSWMHRIYKRTNDKYWDFSIDELARFDIPTSVHHILKTTGSLSLSYIGFSNGSAQMFAALATNHALNKLVDCFIALAPACKIQTLNPEAERFGLLYPLLSSSRSLYYKLFGLQAMLGLTATWKKILSPRLFTHVMSFAVWSLFSWYPLNVAHEVREMFYAHIYSTTSTKVVHHWFQMLKSGKFEFYDDTGGKANGNDIVSVPQYRIKDIVVPVALICGGLDHLSNIEWLQSQLQESDSWKVAGYGHLDFLMSRDVPTLVFPIISDVLTRRRRLSFRSSEHKPQLPSFSTALMASTSEFPGNPVGTQNNIFTTRQIDVLRSSGCPHEKPLAFEKSNWWTTTSSSPTSASTKTFNYTVGCSCPGASKSLGHSSTLHNASFLSSSKKPATSTKSSFIFQTPEPTPSLGFAGVNGRPPAVFVVRLSTSSPAPSAVELNALQNLKEPAHRPPETASNTNITDFSQVGVRSSVATPSGPLGSLPLKTRTTQVTSPLRQCCGDTQDCTNEATSESFLEHTSTGPSFLTVAVTSGKCFGELLLLILSYLPYQYGYPLPSLIFLSMLLGYAWSR